MVLTLQTLVVGLVAKIIASIAGVSLQVCLYLFAHHHNPRVKAFSLILLALSVTMTTCYIEDTWQQQRQQKDLAANEQVQNSYQIQQHQLQISEVNQQIANLMETARQDSLNGYRERSLSTQATIDALKQERRNLQNQLSGITPIASTMESNNLSNNPVLRLSLFIFIAALIDVSAMIALSSPTKQRPGLEETSDNSQSGQDRPTRSNPFSHLKVVQPDPDYQKVVDALKTGQVPPSKNQVRKQLNIGAQKVADYFSRMKHEGIVFQDDKGWYQLVV
ncbi:MAG: hypothetical protein LPD71_00065 [Shewanella sp.]|nr:hypothetical protein [Shewanella sp.]MCF1437196.1 hypothetical protein [Shewanella sp.]MCF1459490.1 hypothetical protein [Shewanella sp.]